LKTVQGLRMQNFSLLVKPAGADCNLSCRYCFYLGTASLYADAPPHRMSQKTLEQLIGSYMTTAQPQYAFAWQGGEPTLMGLEFFDRVVRLQMKYGRSGASVANHLQTNATLIDESFARFLSHYRFLVGVSLDGPKPLHDQYRHDSSGRGSHSRVVRTLEILRKHNVPTNVLTLITRANAAEAQQVYAYLCDRDILHHQYIPCVEFDQRGRLKPYALTAQMWGDFLCQIFDAWWETGVGRVSVRYFDSLVLYLASGQRNLCHMDRKCGQYFLVEHNGDVYPCDFFARAEMKIGNILQKDWQNLISSRPFTEFAESKQIWNKACDVCRYLEFCSADCLKHRLDYGNGGSRQKSWLCDGYRRFFDHALPRLKQLARNIARPETQTEPGARLRSAKVGRNQPCSCGSGKKYKKCCAR